MNINAIGFYSLNRTQYDSPYSKRDQTASSSASLERPSLGYMSYPLNFTAAKSPIPKEIGGLKGIGLTCIYCGRKMIPKSVFESLEWMSKPQMRSLASFLDVVEPIKNTLTKKELEIVQKLHSQNEKKQIKRSLAEAFRITDSKVTPALKNYIYKKHQPAEYSKKTIEIIKRYEECLSPVKKTVFAEIEKYNKKHPEATLLEIMVALRPKHLKSLIKKQAKALDNIDSIAQKLSDESRLKITALTNKARAEIIREEAEDPFKRQKFLEEINKEITKLPERANINELRAAIKKMPFSSNSVDAFIVKYSGKMKISEEKEIKKDLIEVISFEERKIYDQIKQKFGAPNSNKTVEEIIANAKVENAEALATAKKELAEELNEKALLLAVDFNKTMFKVINHSRKGFTNPNTDTGAVRQDLLNNIRKLRNIIDENYLRPIIEKASQMPNPKNNIDALIVKHKDDFGLLPPKVDRAGKPISTREEYILEGALGREERQIFEKLKKYYLQRPKGISLQEEINKHYADSVKNVEEKQSEVLKELAELTIRISENFKKEVRNLTKGTDDLELKDFSLKTKLIRTPRVSDEKTLISIASKIPTPRNNISAFIVKYAGNIPTAKLKTTNFVHRSDREIGQSIIVDSVESIEHFRPQSEWILAELGRDDIDNLGLACGSCNWERANEKLHRYIKSHPQIIKNNSPQKQMDMIIEGINNGTIQNLDTYPAKVKKVLEVQSRNPKTGETYINLDISKLDLSKPRTPNKTKNAAPRKKAENKEMTPVEIKEQNKQAAMKAQMKFISKILHSTQGKNKKPIQPQ